MGSRKTVLMTTAVLGFLGAAFLVSGLNISPMRWMQEVLFDGLGTHSATMAHAAQPQEKGLTVDAPIQLAKVLGRPAGKKGESPEEKAIDSLEKPVPPGQVRKRSKAELVDQCNKQARCKAKLQEAQKSKGKRPKNVRPAGEPGESSEEKALSQIPKPTKPTPSPRQQKSELTLPEENATVLSWLNPFAVSTAHAQSAFSLHLTPQNRWSSTPYGNLNLYGVTYWGNYYLYPSLISTTSSLVENRPYVYFNLSVPSEGWYLVNIQGGRGKAKLRHRSGPIIETWDFTSQACSTCDYLTAEYLTAGYHYFYFWPDGTNMYFYSVSVDSY